MVRSTIAQANLLIQVLEGYNFPAAYILNRVPSKLVLDIPCELWTWANFELENLHHCGCSEFVRSPLISMEIGT